MKRLMGVLLTFVLVVSSVWVSMPVKAASVKKLSMKVGDTKKLNVWKNNNTYKVSGKKYVKVTKSGKVKAMKKGTATVTVKHGKKMKKFKITVKDVYLSVDFTKITRAQVYNLQSGKNVELDKDHLYIVKNVLQEKNLVKDLSLKNLKKPVGGGKYGIHLYNAEGKELYNIAIYTDYVSVFQGDCYRMKKPLDLSELKALF